MHRSDFLRDGLPSAFFPVCATYTSFLGGGCVYEAFGALGRGGLSGPLISGRVAFTTGFSFSSTIVGSWSFDPDITGGICAGGRVCVWCLRPLEVIRFGEVLGLIPSLCLSLSPPSLSFSPNLTRLRCRVRKCKVTCCDVSG